MKKVLKKIFFGTIFIVGLFYFGCSSSIPEEGQIDAIESESTDTDSGRHCFGGREGHGGHSPHGHSGISSH